MLKFWKKPEIKGKKNDDNIQLRTSDPLYASLDLEEIDLESDASAVQNFSRLSKPLSEMIKDSEVMGYFIQFLENLNVSVLVKCMMDIESYSATLSGNEKLVSWEKVKGLNRTKDFTGNGFNYTNATVCDISSYMLDKSGKIIGKTKVQAASEETLREMEHIEEELFTLLESKEVPETTADSLRIFYKYFSSNAPYKILVGKPVFRRIVDNIKNKCCAKTYEEVGMLIMTVLEKEFYSNYLKSDCHCKYQMSILTGCTINVYDILYNELALFYFMEYLENEGSLPLLEFWMAANNFYEQHSKQGVAYNANLAQTDAMIIYDKYFSLQATQSLHVGDQVRSQIEERICREEGPLSNCFIPVQNLIARYLEKRHLSSFLHSQLYFNFLAELISTVNAGPSCRSGGSDCSSEVSSISATNTLLVSAEKKDKRSLNMNIDSRQIYDPDSLWRRSRNTGLTLGRVNELGRFQTDLEPEPDKKIGIESRISKAMKKLVHLEEEDKAKEEMAWQVAEMIVKDVTNLTMPSSQP